MTNEQSNFSTGVSGSGIQSQGQFLSFRLGDEEYGVEVLRVREIIGLLGITPVPQTPAYVKGVINLRGKIIPVIELRRKFGMESVAFTDETCIIVVEVANSPDDERFEMGVIVDTVSEVQDIDSASIQPPPNFGQALNTQFILGMGQVKVGERESVLILLDIDKVVSLEEIGALSSSQADECDENGETRAA